MLEIEVLVATINQGIQNVASHLLPPIEGVRYLITWQQTDNFEVPPIVPIADRNDVRILVFHDKGLSRNRNHGLQNATGDILVISDDDAQYTATSFENIRKGFEHNPEAHILLFQISDEKGKPFKTYSPTSYSYEKRPRFSYVSSLEITLRNNFHYPPFDERFGLGSDYLSCGEEEVFIEEAHRKQAQIIYLPSVIVQTNRTSTGSTFLIDPRVRRSKGAVLYLLHGFFGAVLRCAKFALTLKSPHKIHAFKDMYNGINYIRKAK